MSCDGRAGEGSHKGTWVQYLIEDRCSGITVIIIITVGITSLFFAPSKPTR